MTQKMLPDLPRSERNWLVTKGLLRAFASAAVLITLYFLAPSDRTAELPIGVSLTLAMGVLLAVCVWQIRRITQAPYPALRAVEALAITAPLFLLVFAASYFLLSQSDPTSFNTADLTRADMLYFTVTVFATVGFGDIVAASQNARMLVTVQMLLDLLILGLGIRVFIGAVRRGRERQVPGGSDVTPEGPEA